MTHHAAIIAASRTLDQPFSFEDLVVACWQQYPDRFSLRGYAAYPDPRKVSINLYRHAGGRTRQTGLVHLGWIVRVGLRRFQVNVTDEEIAAHKRQCEENVREAWRKRKGALQERGGV